MRTAVRWIAARLPCLSDDLLEAQVDGLLALVVELALQEPAPVKQSLCYNSLT